MRDATKGWIAQAIQPFCHLAELEHQTEHDRDVAQVGAVAIHLVIARFDVAGKARQGQTEASTDVPSEVGVAVAGRESADSTDAVERNADRLGDRHEIVDDVAINALNLCLAAIEVDGAVLGAE